MFFVMTVVLAVVGSHYQSALARRSLPYSARASSLAGIPVSSQNSDASRNHDGLCLTPGCDRAARQLIDNMNMTADPCTDFYQFACGGWIQRQNIPEDRSSVTQFSLIQDELDAKLRHIVEKPVDKARDPSFVVKLKHLYQSCVNTSYLEDVGNEPLEKILRDLGGWPVIETNRWNESAFDWLETVIKLRELGFEHNIIFDLSVIPDDRNNTQRLISLDAPISAFVFSVSHPAYLKLITDAVALFGADSEPDPGNEVKSFLLFEETLEDYALSHTKNSNVSTLYNRITLGELKELVSSISWDTYFNKLLVDPVSDDEKINVVVPEFVEQVAKLLNRTSKRIMANYMIWRVVFQSYPTLGKTWRDRLFEYNAAISGATKESPRWEQCISMLAESMPVSLSNLYLKNYLRGSSEDDVLTIFNYTKNEFSKILQDVSWMDPQIRQHAKEKVEAIVPFIGYPSELLNDTLLNELHKNLSISADDYFSNRLHVRKWSTDYNYGQLRKPNVKGEWITRSQVTDVNSYYTSVENSIEVKMGMLKGVFFGKDRPNYLNFGAIGSVIGHEITHSFDDVGRQYDKEGYKMNLWNHETEERFKERAQCIINKYGNYTEPQSGLQLDGIRTLDENIADIGGIKGAFRAYLQWEKDNGPEGALPGLNYTAHQLFWISAANVWCVKDWQAWIRASEGPHSLPPYRVIGPMSDLREFAEEFSCPIGYPMNPEHKCTVW